MEHNHHLLPLIICPQTGSDLSYMELDNGGGLLSKDEGIIYPIIDNIVVMEPITQIAKKMCADFLNRNKYSLSKLDGHYNQDLTLKVLCQSSDTDNEKWHKDEMDYWETRFKKRLDGDTSETPGWNRTLPRKKILDRLPQELNKKTIVELGCGASHTLFDIYGKDLPHYIGLDLSYYACRLTQQILPHGLYIQASAKSLPFRNNSIDVMIAYGTLHHLPHHENNIPSLLSVIKPKGYLIGFDPLLKPRVPRPKYKTKSRAKRNDQEDGANIDLRSGKSPHNEWIDWDNVLAIMGNKAKVIETHFEYGPLRGLLVQTLYDKLGIRTKTFTRILMALDQIWLVTLGKLHKALGPGGIHYAIQKY